MRGSPASSVTSERGRFLELDVASPELGVDLHGHVGAVLVPAAAWLGDAGGGGHKALRDDPEDVVPCALDGSVAKQGGNRGGGR